jgi:nickel/cobalt exporter
MPDIAQIIATNAANPWLYLPAAVLLGAFHALEPGHSKSVMAAFVVAVRGTPAQAVLLGVAAAVGHTLIVWALVLAALWYGNEMITQQAYPWLVLISGLMILAIAARMIWLLRPRPARHHHHHHDHGGHDHHPDHDHDHHHGHKHQSPQEIAARFGGRAIKTWEIAWFGFTGGLLPCPAAIAVLLVALKLKAFVLGAAMVGSFSLGLAITLVAIGLAAAWGVRKAGNWQGPGGWTRVLPILSVAIMMAMGLAVAIHGLLLLAGSAGH